MTAALRWPAQVISWIATAFAARNLTPAEYGVVSMAMIAIGLARMVEDFGMDAVLVQDRSIIGDREAQLAGLIILAGGVLCALFIALAHPVGWFFNEPMVVPVIMALSLLCVADAIQVVSRAGLQREMKFAQLAWAPLQILCIYAAYYTTLVLFGASLMWTGQFRANMWCSILAGVALPIAFILGTRWGLEGVAWAWAICFPLVNIPAMVIAFRTVEGSLVARVNAVWPALAASTAMAVAVVALRAALPSDPVPRSWLRRWWRSAAWSTWLPCGFSSAVGCAKCGPL